MYKTDEIKISVEQVAKLKKQLEENVWYQYFSDHVKEVKTWIDFETKIEEALILVCKFINKINLNFENHGKINNNIRLLTITNSEINDGAYYLSLLDIKSLIKLKMCTENQEYGQSKGSGTFSTMPDRRKGFINDDWYYVVKKSEYGFSSEKYISFLSNQLNKLITIFNSYLELIISNLNQVQLFDILEMGSKNIGKIYSFNYTNTYQKFYDQSVETDYLHGSSGKEQNIVLGVSELEDDSLIKLKAFGFTKYHQKIFNDTDYLFLDKYKTQIQSEKDMLGRFQKNYASLDEGSYQNELHHRVALNLNFYIWGHSLDLSDHDYIQDIFSLNDGMDRNVRVTVYYFDKNAKFALLNNLLAILKKDKVERWMKNEWLKFKKNPEIKFTEAIL